MAHSFRALLLILAMPLLAPAAALAQTSPLTVSFTTTPAGGKYDPKNIVAVWVMGPDGKFVKTIGRWAGTRRSHLVAWVQAAGSGDTDAVSGATRSSHSGTLTVNWDLKNKSGTIVPDGTYTLRMELCDSNASSPSENNQGTFTFVKGSAPASNSTSGGGFQNVMIKFTPPTGPACGNGQVETGEVCDGNCPTSCSSTNACAPQKLMGSAMTCNATCVTQPISTCAPGDGCCPAGCTYAMDLDCPRTGGGFDAGVGMNAGVDAGGTSESKDAGTGNNPPPGEEMGCSQSAGLSEAALLLALGLLAWAPRRRRARG